jgi:DNA-binding NarL/FixJ family response regulator
LGRYGSWTPTARTARRAGQQIDSEVVRQLLARTHRTDPLGRLTPRERDVLALMAEGRSNTSIADTPVVSMDAVEKHVANIFMKLDLPADDERHQRRVMAVIRYLND